MADHITVHVAGGKGVSHYAVRKSLASVSEDDVSKSSPITAGVPEAGIATTDDGNVRLRVAGHSGSFTKTSERALLAALRDGLPESASVSVEAGGYDSDD